MEILRVENIYKSFNMGQSNEYHALKGIDLKIKSGEFVAVMGPSGSGKSTLLNMIAGFDNPTSGKVFINNTEISNISENKRAILRRDLIGFVFQSFNLLSDLNALDNVMMPLLIKGVNKKQAREKALTCLEATNLKNKAYNKPEELSGGEKQRVAIARALSTDPSILIADEPTGNLDSKSSDAILALLKELNKSKKQTILMVTHSDQAASITDRVLYIKDGQLCNSIA
ncbi:ABC transporter ATP-binding protein [Clostridium thermarum]|uniref:ABC transporter ATP-binding protein n=1 Tax=Clostridium thermarum TaxID=1716543 RepID=UPI0013D125A7|nr:ABC transporter ATP-binding protein [Clostridium thermarum]